MRRYRFATVFIAIGLAVLLQSGLLSPTPPPTLAAATTHACPSDLTAWKSTLGAEWLACNRVDDLTTTNNPYTTRTACTEWAFRRPAAAR